jgi:hypothetical protein
MTLTSTPKVGRKLGGPVSLPELPRAPHPGTSGDDTISAAAAAMRAAVAAQHPVAVELVLDVKSILAPPCIFYY